MDDIKEHSIMISDMGDILTGTFNNDEEEGDAKFEDELDRMLEQDLQNELDRLEVPISFPTIPRTNNNIVTVNGQHQQRGYQEEEEEERGEVEENEDGEAEYHVQEPPLYDYSGTTTTTTPTSGGFKPLDLGF